MRLPSILAAFSLLPVLLLTGCILTPTAKTTPENGRGIQGIVHGGQQPIQGAHVYVYAAASSAYESAATPVPSVSLLSSNVIANNPSNHGQDGSNNYYVTTDANGDFNITNDYTCTAGQQVYLYAVGGDSGGGANSAIGLLATLGDCPVAGNFASSLFVLMDEVSTIATAYSFAGFALDATDVSYGGSALGKTGITHAFGNAANLANISSGQALAATPAGNGQVPQETINSLANILAACINATDPTFTTCSTILNDATSNGIPTGMTGSGTVPTDTATAAINIAHYPGANVADLFGTPVPEAPFSPPLPASPPPNDFTIAIVFPNTSSTDISITNSSINNPIGIAIDASGNAWISNYAGGVGDTVTELNGSTGADISPVDPITGGGFTGGGLSGPYAIAIDGSGNAWITNSGFGSTGQSVTELNGSTGAPISGPSGYTGGGLKNPEGISVDASGYIWVANAGDGSVTQLYGSNAPVGHSPGDAISGANGYTNGGLDAPVAIAIDNSGYVWVADLFGNDTAELNGSAPPSGSPGDNLSGSSGYTGGGQSAPTAVAIDASGYVWIANLDNSVSELYGSSAVSPNNPGDGISPSSGYVADGNMNGPSGIAIDGGGNVWIANQGASVYELYGSNAVSPNNPGDAISGPNGYTGGGVLGSPQGIAVDGSGDVWVADTGAYQVVEFIGAAAPVVTPIVANLITPYTHLASKP